MEVRKSNYVQSSINTDCLINLDNIILINPPEKQHTDYVIVFFLPFPETENNKVSWVYTSYEYCMIDWKMIVEKVI